MRWLTVPVLLAPVLVAVLCFNNIEDQRIKNIWPVGVDFSYETYENWEQNINTTQHFLISYPRTCAQIVLIVNWAYVSGRYVRVKGHRHSYPPITVSDKDDPSKTVIIDMTKYMKTLRMGSFSVASTKLNTVVAEPGASMQDFLTFAERNGCGIVMAPVIGGDATVGGVLAIGGHGSGIPAINEKLAIAIEIFDKYDPHHVITNSFLRQLMVPYKLT